jgi:glyoxylase-like metal-dependent hydrolase (beta-lactamase superfamily II)
MKFANSLVRALTAMLVAMALSSSGCSAAPLKETRSLSGKGGRIHVYESDGNGFNTRNFFYDNGEEVVAFDTQFTPELAEKSIAFLRTKTANPITYVVVTHPNPDKFNGMSAFQKLGAKAIASRRTAESLKGVHEYKKYFFVQVAKMFTDAAYPRLSQVDLTFEETYDLRLKNGETIVLRELGQPGVSSNQTVASIPSAGAVMVGDLVHYNAHAWLEGGIVNGKATPRLKDWIAGLNELRALFKDAPETVVYGGRGDAVRVGNAVSAQIAYLGKADALVTAYVRGLRARKSELLGDRAGEHHKALQARFEEAFPGYALGYMIQYGVYGLVNSKL